MNGFVAAAPTKHQPIIENGTFWPAISTDEFTASMRLDGTTPPERQREALVTAMVNVNRELLAWRKSQEAQGFASLSDVPYDDPVDGKSPKEHNYRRAVFCIAKANITERYRDFDATAKGDRKAASLETEIADLWRDARWSMRELQDLNHNTTVLV